MTLYVYDESEAFAIGEEDYPGYRDATVDDVLAYVRAGVESGTIKGTEVNLCSVHGSVMTGAVFHEGQRICQYAWYSGHAVEACFGYRGVVIPVSDGGSET